MRFIIYIFFISSFYTILSCGNDSPKVINEDKKVAVIHPNLISFKSIYIAEEDGEVEMSDEEFKRLYDDINFYTETDTISYTKDTIYISYLTIVNACAEYEGNIEYRNDSLILSAYNTRDEECASGTINRLIYKVHNPENKRYFIKKF